MIAGPVFTTAATAAIFGLSKEDVELLTGRKHPHQTELERALVALAREGQLFGVNKKPARYSATTIQWFVDCQRKFYWPTVAGLEDPPSPAQAFGTALHALQEKYLLTGELPPRHTPEGILASIGLPLLPKPGTPGLYVEEPFEAQFDGIPVVITGTRDFGVDPQDVGAPGFLLGDHKTARSKRYPKTKEWLRGNIQSNLYAYTKWAELYARGFTSLKLVDKQWAYYYKEEREAEKVRAVDSLEHVAQQFDDVIKPAVIKMATMAAEAPRISDVPLPEDRSVCDSYGGCPHRARCFGFGNRENAMGVMAGRFTQQAIQQKAQQIAQPAAQAAPAQGAGPAINPPPAPRTAPKVVAKPAAPPPPPPPAEEERFVDEAGLPCDAQGNPLVNADGERCDWDGNPIEVEGATEVPAAQEATAPIEAPAEKPKRTRKPKAETTAAAPAQEETREARMPTGSRTAPGYNPKHDFWLFVGARPAKGFDAPTAYVEEILGAAQAKAAASIGSDHYRAGSNNYGVLEAAFATWLEENALAGAVIVDPSSIVARDVIGLLRAHAAVVVERFQ